MRKITARVMALAIAATHAAPALLVAQGKGQEKGKDKDKDRGRGERDERVEVVDNRGRDRDESFDRKHGVPPGLAKKPGGMPPGQYKKRYNPNQGVGVLRDVFVRNGYTVVRTVPYGTSQYVYYRAANGTEQRAIIAPGSTQLGFTNVPAAILQEVLRRLY